VAFANVECFYGGRQGSFERGIRNDLIKGYLILPYDEIYELTSLTAHRVGGAIFCQRWIRGFSPPDRKNTWDEYHQGNTHQNENS
jgi:hypothetical protein